MGDTRTFLRSFAGGEIGPDMYGRMDDTRFLTGLARCRNQIVRPQGGVTRRPGTRMVREVKDSTQPVRLIPWQFRPGQTFAIEMGPGWFRFHTSGATLVPRSYVPSQVVTVNAGTGEITWPVPHGLLDNDPVQLTTTGTNPTGIPPGDGTSASDRWAAFVSPTVIRLRAAIGGAPITSYASAGTGTITGHFHYQQGDGARLSGSTYHCLAEHIGTTPPNVTFWDLVTTDNVFEVRNPFGAAELPQVKFRQSGDVMVFTHPSHPVRELRRWGPNRWSWTSALLGVDLPVASPVATASAVEGVTLASIGTGPNALWTTTTKHQLGSPGGLIYVSGVTLGVPPPPIDPNGKQWRVVEVPSDTTFRVQSPTTGAQFDGGSAASSGGRVDYTTFNARREHRYIATYVDASGREGPPSAPTSVTANLFAAGSFVTIAPVLVPGPGFGIVAANVYKEEGGAFGFIGRVDTLPDGSFGFRDERFTPNMLQKVGFSDEETAQRRAACVEWFQQRRVYAEGQTVWASRTGTEGDFSFRIPVEDDDRLLFDLPGSHEIRHLVALGHLLVMGVAGEWRVTGINSDTLTPASRSTRPQTAVGCSHVVPQLVNNTVVFVAARGGHVREMGWSADQGSYQTGDLSLRVAHLFDGFDITASAYAKAPLPLLWFTSSSGRLLGLTYVPEEQVGGWHWHDTQGAWESVCSVPEGVEDATYLVARRTIGGATKRFVEVMAPLAYGAAQNAFFVDCGLTYTGVPTFNISAAGHLEGCKVQVLADGLDVGDRTIVGGALSPPLSVAASTIHVGLGYDTEGQTLPMWLQIDALGQGRPKNLERVVLRVQNSGRFEVGTDAADARAAAIPATSTPYSGLVEVLLPGRWQPDGQLWWQQRRPLPLSVLSMALQVTVGG